MQPSLVGARRILFLLIAPLLKSFFEALRERADDPDDPFVAETLSRLRGRVGGTSPRIWTVDTAQAPVSALTRLWAQAGEVTLGDLLRDPRRRDRLLACVCLVALQDGRETILPDADFVLRPGCQILFAGTQSAQHLLEATLNNEYTLAYLKTGIDPPRGWVMQWLSKQSESELTSA